jgi:DNA-binding transcriptional regulator YdaS (Cro superfamily)
VPKPLKKLAQYIAAHEASQNQFARRAKISQSLISRLIAGERSCNLETAIKIERATRGEVKVAYVTGRAVSLSD